MYNKMQGLKTRIKNILQFIGTDIKEDIRYENINEKARKELQKSVDHLKSFYDNL